MSPARSHLYRRNAAGRGAAKLLAALLAAGTFLPAGGLAGAGSLARPSRLSLTSVSGVLVGHHRLEERPSGCTVVLTPAGAVAGVDVRGGAPGTRETDLLNPTSTVQEVHGVALAGGSAFGLGVADGVQRFLEERGAGFETGLARVPIVPAAILYDLGVGGAPNVRPGPDCGYRAAAAASSQEVQEGNVGAGAGATVGKLLGFDRAMRGGLGSSALIQPDGLVVGALAVVNAAGDVVDPASGEVIAGARTPDGKDLAGVAAMLRRGEALRAGFSGKSTTLVVVATNARLTQAEATKVAQMAHDGLARTLVPVHTPVDGDVVFALATGEIESEGALLRIGALAAEVTAEAVLRGVRSATGLPELPAAGELAPGDR